MKENFAPSLAAVLIHEGGFVLSQHDPGGATCKGVTQQVYDDWRVSHGEPKRTVRDIDQAEVEALYRANYWDRIRGDDLPKGVDYCVFDFAVNSGVNRAARFLQRAAMVAEDGVIGPATLATVNKAYPTGLVDLICDLRLCFLKSLKTWQFFGRGWGKRVEEVRARAKDMAE